MTDDSLPAHGPGAAPNGNFALTEFKVAIGGDSEAADRRVKLTKAAADFSQDQFPVAAAIDGKRADRLGDLAAVRKVALGGVRAGEAGPTGDG